MPLDGDKLTELLSGYLDGELNESELQQVQRAIAEDVSVQARLNGLKAASSSLTELSAAPQRKLSSDFTQRVMAQISQSNVEQSHVQRASKMHSRTNVLRAAATIVAVAAVLALVAVNRGWLMFDSPAPQAENSVPQNSIPESTEPQLPGIPGADETELPQLATIDGPNEQHGGTSVPVSYLSELPAPLAALVLHVRPTSVADNGRLIEQVLRQFNITPVAPIVADDTVEKALSEVSMIATDEGTQAGSSVYFVWGEAVSIDAALRAVWADTTNFPEANYNFAMDNPQIRLMGKIARSTGERFASNKAFAAPLAIESDSGEANIDVGAIASPVYVSIENRQEEQAVSMGMLGGGGGMSPLLIVVHKPMR